MQGILFVLLLCSCSLLFLFPEERRMGWPFRKGILLFVNYKISGIFRRMDSRSNLAQSPDGFDAKSGLSDFVALPPAPPASFLVTPPAGTLAPPPLGAGDPCRAHHLCTGSLLSVLFLASVGAPCLLWPLSLPGLWLPRLLVQRRMCAWAAWPWAAAERSWSWAGPVAGPFLVPLSPAFMNVPSKSPGL